MKRFRIVYLFLVLASLAPRAGAQAAGQIGIIFQVPTAIGFIWHYSDKLAIRPEVSISRGSSSFSSGTSTFESQNLNWGLAVSTPYYLSNRDNVRTYVSPRIAYSRSRTTSDGFPAATATQVNYSGSFGAQYAPVARFNIFGETGYSLNTTKSGSSESTTSALVARSAVGVILYLGH